MNFLADILVPSDQRLSESAAGIFARTHPKQRCAGPILFSTLFLISTFFSPTPLAAKDSNHSQVEISQSKVDQGLALTFKVKPAEGMAVSLDAPWKLDLEAKDLDLPKKSWAKADLDGTLPGFQVKTTSKPKETKGTLSYTLVSFICTKEKTQCYRDIHKGTYEWNQAKP